jgi:hypothetical protein
MEVFGLLKDKKPVIEYSDEPKVEVVHTEIEQVQEATEVKEVKQIKEDLTEIA